MKTKTEIKAKNSFNFQCKRASKCRHEKYKISCNSCNQFETCEIQNKIKKQDNYIFSFAFLILLFVPLH